MLALRPYQEAAVAAVLAGQTRRPLLVLPTGSGKTIIAAALSQRVPHRTLFVVHREELVQQAVAKFHLVWPTGDVGIVRGTQDEHDRRVVVASIQTLQQPRRWRRLDPASFSLVILDECHHALADSYKAVLTALGFLPTPRPAQILLGITATPERGDKASLAQVFERIVYRQSIGDLIRQGYLTPVRGLQVRSRVDLSHVRTRAGDFDLKALSLAVDTPTRNRLIVRAWQRYAAGRPTVVFTVDVAHAQHVAEAFRAAQIPADWVAGILTRDERARRLQALRAGTVQVLANAMLLTEGWDEPTVSAVLLARPTKSRPLWIQMVGRGLRIAPDKTDCLVLDVADNRHDLVTLAALQDLGVTVAPAEPRGRHAPGLTGPAAEDPEDLPTTATLVATPRDLLTRSAFAWQRQSGRLTLQAGPGRRVQLIPDGDGYRVQAWAGAPVVLHPDPLPLEYAQGVAEDWVRGQDGGGFARKDAKWRRLPPSAKQVALARTLGLHFPDGTTREGAHDALEAAMAQARLQDPTAPWRQDPATPKQIAWLTAHRIRVRDGITKGEAADLMSRIMGRSS